MVLLFSHDEVIKWLIIKLLNFILINRNFNHVVETGYVKIALSLKLSEFEKIKNLITWSHWI
jgi:hypothetical protein